MNAVFLRERGRDSMEIFQAEMHKETEAGQSIVQDVLFKFAEDDEDLFDAMKHEADIYNNYLKPLYGQGILEFHGLYQGTLEELSTDNTSSDSEPSICACLVLQSRGNSIRSFSEIDVDFSVALMRLVMHLHDNLKILQGSLHLAPRNILDVDGRPFIIDFELSKAIHKCAMRMDIFKHRGDPEPVGSQLGGCTELHSLLNKLAWWLPTDFMWYGFLCTYEDIWRPADIFELETHGFFSARASDEERWDKAMEVWGYLEIHWERYHSNVQFPTDAITTLDAYRREQRARSTAGRGL
ncbi:hypothetical protein DXG03_005652 [Asterophora parasitica]|uniref:Protein kinase domain-containing protein n=1 Tax=Asterophora parasitica TaxID=117018 RepID=A0A9P7G065_9AGAR|nr:hypothetical protein DXG03_005652 [Asterophora parasitica]